MKSYFDPNTGECLFCHGSGECPYCDGDGEILDDECSICSGYGECPVCKGAGERELPETVDIHDFRSSRPRRPRRRHHTMEDTNTGDAFPQKPIPRQRLAVDILTPDVSNYRGHCIAAISAVRIPQNDAHQLIRLLPDVVSYDQFIAIEGLVHSNHRYHLIREQVIKLFYPWWKRPFIDLLSG